MAQLPRKLNQMDDEPKFCLLKCDCGNSLIGNLMSADDICEKCGEKMRLINTWKASDY